jgi:hypothetical protein
VPPDVLATYVGTYVANSPDSNIPISVFTVSLADGQLFIDFGGKGRLPLVPLSRNVFSPRLLGSYEFVADERGVVTHLIAHTTEGDTKAVRTPGNGQR